MHVNVEFAKPEGLVAS